MESAYAVALVDRRELPLAEWTSVLSVRERMEAATYMHPVRRARTITSRILTKYLVTRSERGGFRRPEPIEIEAAMNSGWMSVEVLSGTAKNRAGARIFQAGNAFFDLSVASSHCEPYTASCISRDHVGLDLERIEPRRQEFYARTFSEEERDWVSRIPYRQGISKEAVFTFLWSVKEAFLKASGRHDLSVWTFPRWTVRLDDFFGRALQFSKEFINVSGGIHHRDFSQALGIGAMRVDDMILTTVWY